MHWGQFGVLNLAQAHFGMQTIEAREQTTNHSSDRAMPYEPYEL